MRPLLAQLAIWVSLLLWCACPVGAQQPDYQGSWDGSCSPTAGAWPFFAMAAEVSTSGNVYVLGSNRIYQFTPTGACVSEWPVYSGNFTHTIWDIAIDSQDRLHATDQGQNRVVTFDSNGDSLWTFGSAGSGPGQFNWIFASGGGYVGVGPGDVIYVTDNNLDRVTRFTSAGTYLSHWSTLHAGEGARPGSIAIDDSGHVFLADQLTHRVMKFTSDGTFLLSWGGAGSGPGQFASPSEQTGPDGVAVGPEGHIFVGDGFNHRIQVFDSMGQYLREWGTAGSGASQFGDFLRKVDFDVTGNVYVPDNSNRRVSKYGPGPVPTLRSSWGSIKSRYR